MLFSSARMRGLNIVVLKVYFMTPLMIEVHISIWSFQLSCEELWIVCLGRYEERSDYIGSKKMAYIVSLCHWAKKRKRLTWFKALSRTHLENYFEIQKPLFMEVWLHFSLGFTDVCRKLEKKYKVSTSFAFICNKELFALKCEIANWKELKITWQLRGALPWAQLL